MNKFEVHIAATDTKIHSVRPVVILEDNKENDYVKVLICGSDSLKKNADGSIISSSMYYKMHPEYKIDPLIVPNAKSQGFDKPTYINIYNVKRIKRSKIGPSAKGVLNDDTINKLKAVINIDDIVDESLLQMIER